MTTWFPSPLVFDGGLCNVERSRDMALLGGDRDSIPFIKPIRHAREHSEPLVEKVNCSVVCFLLLCLRPTVRRLAAT